MATTPSPTALDEDKSEVPSVLDLFEGPDFDVEDDGRVRRSEIRQIDATGKTSHINVRAGSGVQVATARAASELPVLGLGDASSSELVDAVSDFASVLDTPDVRLDEVREAAASFVAQASSALSGGVPSAEMDAVLLAAGAMTELRAGDRAKAAEVIATLEALRLQGETPDGRGLLNSAAAWAGSWSRSEVRLGIGEDGLALAKAAADLNDAVSAARSGFEDRRGAGTKAVREAAERASDVIEEVVGRSFLSRPVEDLRRLSSALAVLRVVDKEELLAASRVVAGVAMGAEGRSGMDALEVAASARAYLQSLHQAVPERIEAVVGEDLRVGEASIDAWYRANENAYGGDSSRNDSGQEGGTWEARDGVEWKIRLHRNSHGNIPFVSFDAAPEVRALQAARGLSRIIEDVKGRSGLALLAADMLGAEERYHGVVNVKADPIDIEAVRARNPRLSFEEVSDLAARMQSEADAKVRKDKGAELPLGRIVRLRGGVETKGAHEPAAAMVGAAEVMAQEMAKSGGLRTVGELRDRLRAAAAKNEVPLIDGLKLHALMRLQQALDRPGSEPEKVEVKKVALLLDSQTPPELAERLIRRNVEARPGNEPVAIAVSNAAMEAVVRGLEAKLAEIRAKGESAPTLAVSKAKSLSAACDGVQVAIGVFSGLGNEFDKVLGRVAARGTPVLAVSPDGRSVTTSSIHRTLRDVKAKDAMAFEAEKDQRAKRLAAAGLSSILRGGTPMQVFGDTAVLDRKLLTVIGRLTDAEVSAVLGQVKAEGLEGVAWFASPEDPAALPPAGLNPVVVGSEQMGTLGVVRADWDEAASRSGEDRRVWNSKAGSVEAVMALPLDGAPNTVKNAALLPGSPAGEFRHGEVEGRTATQILATVPDRVVWQAGSTGRVLTVLDEVAWTMDTSAPKAGLTAVDRMSGARVPLSELGIGCGPGTHVLVRGETKDAVGLTAVRRLDGTLAVLRQDGKIAALGRPTAGHKTAVAIARDAAGVPVRVASMPSVDGKDVQAQLSDVASLGKRELVNGSAAHDEVRRRALEGAVVVARILPADVTLENGLITSGSGSPVLPRSLRDYVECARAVGSDIAVVGERETQLRTAAMERGWRVLTPAQQSLVPLWEKVGEVARAAMERADGLQSRYPHALAAEVAERRGLTEDQAKGLTLRVVRHKLASVPGREMGLAAALVLDDKEREDFQSAFNVARMSLPQAGRLSSTMSMPSELAETSARIEKASAGLGKGAKTPRELAAAVETSSIGSKEVKTAVAKWARTASGKGTDLADKAGARLLFEDALGKGDAKEAFQIMRAMHLREMASGRALEASRMAHGMGR